MRFNLVDRIIEVDPARSIRAVKNLTLAEEYLADHFPTFPVMPGVLMLQALVEAGSWLVRVRDDFKDSIVVMREAKNVKYGTFMEPGRQMMLTAEVVEAGNGSTSFKGKGEIEGGLTVAARFTVFGYSLADKNPAWQSLDERIREHMRSRYLLLRG